MPGISARTLASAQNGRAPHGQQSHVRAGSSKRSTIQLCKSLRNHASRCNVPRSWATSCSAYTQYGTQRGSSIKLDVDAFLYCQERHLSPRTAQAAAQVRNLSPHEQTSSLWASPEMGPVLFHDLCTQVIWRSKDTPPRIGSLNRCAEASPTAEQRTQTRQHIRSRGHVPSRRTSRRQVKGNYRP